MQQGLNSGVNKEKAKFLISFWIRKKDSEEKGKYLSTLTYLEVDWTDGKGRVNEELTLENKGQWYRVLVKVEEIKKGWFKDEVRSFKIEPLSNEYYIPDEPEEWKRGMITNKGLIQIEPTQWRKSGFVLVGLFIVLIIVIAVVVWWKWGKERIR